MRVTLIIFFFVFCIKAKAQNRDSLNTISQKYYEILIDSNIVVEVGFSCGYDGNSPKGWDEINFLLENKQFDLIKQILKGHNPEGRIYAIMALFTAETENYLVLTPADKDFIEKIILSPELIETCDQCGGDRKLASGIFSSFTGKR